MPSRAVGAGRAVIFDAAGTLIRLREGVGESYARLAAEAGSPVSPARLSEAFGQVFSSAPAMVFPELSQAELEAAEKSWWKARVRETFRAADPGLCFSDFDALFEVLWWHFAQATSWKLAPGTEECLNALARDGFRLAVLSNFDLRLPEILSGLGIRQAFECIILPAAARAAKPDPRIFSHCLAALNLAASSALYVGDDPTDDLAGARAAGIRAIDVTEIATLTELPARVSALFDPPR